MDLLTEILAPARPTAIVDVGANPIDGDPPYKAMLAAGLCEVTGFEPQGPALARLEKSKGPRERYLPYALGDGSERTLNICELEGMTSLLVPDPVVPEPASILLTLTALGWLGVEGFRRHCRGMAAAG